MMCGQANIKYRICWACNRHFLLVFRQVTCIISVCVFYFELHTSLLGGFDAYVLRFCVYRQNESTLFTLGFLGIYYVICT